MASERPLRPCLNGKDFDTIAVDNDAEFVTFEVYLAKGVHQLSPYFSIPQGELGCYYAIVRSR